MSIGHLSVCALSQFKKPAVLLALGVLTTAITMHTSVTYWYFLCHGLSLLLKFVIIIIIINFFAIEIYIMICVSSWKYFATKISLVVCGMSP